MLDPFNPLCWTGHQTYTSAVTRAYRFLANCATARTPGYSILGGQFVLSALWMYHLPPSWPTSFLLKNLLRVFWGSVVYGESSFSCWLPDFSLCLLLTFWVYCILGITFEFILLKFLWIFCVQMSISLFSLNLGYFHLLFFYLWEQL